MAFHPYPWVIPSVFNRSGFGPPRGLTPASACPGVAHPASRRRRATQKSPRSDSLSLRLGTPLTSPRAATRWLILQKARRHSAEALLRLLVGARFQALFHSPRGVLFTFPSRYWFAIGRGECSALEGGPPRFGPGSSCPGLLGIRAHRGAAALRVRGSHPLRPAFPCRSAALRLSAPGV